MKKEDDIKYQFFAKEKYPKPIPAYGGYSRATQVGKDIYTPFSGKWKTPQVASEWSNNNKQGNFFRSRGIELKLFCINDDKGCFPATEKTLA